MKKQWYRLLAMMLAVLVALSAGMTAVWAEDGEEEGPAHTPFKRHVLPCEIKAINYDNGPVNVAYSPRTSANWAGTWAYRDNPNKLDFYASSGGILALHVGQWIVFTVEVAESGWFDLSFQYATAHGNMSMELDIDGNPKTYDLDGSGGWGTFLDVKADTMKLAAGTHILKITQKTGETNFSGITFKKGQDPSTVVDFSKKEGDYRQMTIPAVLQAEDFDMGVSASKSGDGKNDGKAYRAADGIDIYQKSGNIYAISLSQGDYVSYSFYAPESAPYLFSIAAKGSGQADAYFDNHPYPFAANVGSDTDYGESEITNIWIPEGRHTIKLVAKTALDLDYLRFANANGDYITGEHLDVKPSQEASEDAFAPHEVYKSIYVSPEGNDEEGTGEESAPFATLARAKQAVAEARADMTGDIVVNLAPGYYPLKKTEEFTEVHGGNNGFNVIYRGQGTESNPTLLSGGTEITGWEKTADGKIWKASAENVKDTRTLYVNDNPAVRARSKYLYLVKEQYFKEGSNKADGVLVDKSEFQVKLAKPSVAECVFEIEWYGDRAPVTDILYDYSAEQTAILFNKTAYAHMGTMNRGGEGKQFYIENAKELLDEPGEFYFDKDEKVIYYYPFHNEDMTTAKTYVGTTDGLVKVSGANPKSRVEGIVFDNLDFRYGAWNELSKLGFAQNQADQIVNGTGVRQYKTSHYQFAVDCAKRISVQNCRFSCMASGGISMINAVTGSRVVGNVIKDVGGSAVIVDSPMHYLKDIAESLFYLAPDSWDRTTDIEVSNNVIRRCSYQLRGFPAISVYYAYNTKVLHNDIKEIPYTGIALGWGWGYDCTEAGADDVSYNRIEDVMSGMHDGAHIYSLSHRRNSYVTNNWFIKTGDIRGGLYYDEGTTFITARDNVFQNMTQYWLFARKNVKIGTNAVLNSYTDTATMVKDEDVIQENGTVVVTDGNWPAEARAIMENAGVEGEYKTLLDGVERPEWRTNWNTSLRPARRYNPADEYAEGILVEEKPIIKVEFSDISGHWAENSIMKMAEAGYVNGVSEGIFAPDDSVSRYQSIWLALRAANISYTDDNWKDIAVEYGLLPSADTADEAVTREEFAGIVMKVYAAAKGKYQLNVAGDIYSDVGDISPEYVIPVLGAASVDLMKGADGAFRPQANLTRAEATVVVQRLNNAVESTL